MQNKWSVNIDSTGWRQYPESRAALAKLQTPEFLSGDLCFRLTESDLLYIQFMRAQRPSDNLIFHFHGSVERRKRPLPTFQPNVRASVRCRPSVHRL